MKVSATRRVAWFLVPIGLMMVTGVNLSSAASLEVASACNTVHRVQPSNSIYQSATGLQIAQTMRYCKLAKISANKLKFWFKPQNRWRLYIRHLNKKCWQINLKESVPTCIIARSQVRQHSQRFIRLNAKIEELNQPHIVAWLFSDFICIHGGEAAWNADTGNGYYGGLQMDQSFENTYGPEFVARWGNANNWPIWAQLTAAARGYAARGFTPWPNTARNCGLR